MQCLACPELSINFIVESSVFSPPGIGTEGKETYDINEVGVAHGNNEIVQRGSVPVDDSVNQVNLGAPTHWVLPEQVILYVMPEWHFPPI